MIRFIANIYLLAYLLDGIISVVDEILKSFFGFDGLMLIRSYVATTVLLSSFAILFLLGIDSRLPKKLFLPLTVFLIWFSFIPEPFKSLLTEQHFYFTFSVMQLLICVAGMLYVRTIAEGKIYLTKSVFTGPLFNWKNTAIYFSTSALLFVGIVVLGSYKLLKTGIHEYTSGFVRIDRNGIYTTEKKYVNGKVSIHLIGMIHIGNSDYYMDIYQSLITGKSLILAEGVFDKERLISDFPSYSKVASFLGLVPQFYMPDKLYHSPRDKREGNIEHYGESPEIDKDAFPHLIRADIDVSEFADETISFLNHIGLISKTSDSLLGLLIAQAQWSKNNMPPEVEKIIMSDLIEKRNAVLLTHLDKWLSEYEQIIVPWGAKHMPGIEDAVITRGFSLDTSKERLAIDFNIINWLEFFRL